MSGRKFSPLRSLARHAKKMRMDMQCDPQWVLDLDAECEALRAEVDQLKEWQASHRDNYFATAEERDSLRAEVGALRKDAERYRALRQSLSGEAGSTTADMPCVCVPMIHGMTYTPDGLDRAIDAAKEASQ